MNNIVKTIVLIFLLCSCQNDEGTRISSVKTSLPTNISSTSVTFNGEILEVGSSPITEHGFIWSSSSNLDFDMSEKIMLGTISTTSTFSQTIETLEGEMQYYFAAFYEDANGIQLGEVLDFSTFKPIINSITPTEAVTGSEISIKGDYFPESSSSISVFFNDVIASVVSISKTNIIVNVPSGLSNDPITVKVVIGDIEVVSELGFTLSYFLQKKTFPHVVDLLGGAEFLFGLENSYYFKVGYDTQEESNINAFWSYNVTQDEFIRKVDFPFSSSVAPLIFEDKGYIVTGTTTGHLSNEFWEYDPNSDTWTQVSDSIPIPSRSLFDFSFTINGKSYIGNGYKLVSTSPLELEYFNDLWMYDHKTKNWTQKNDIEIPISTVISHVILFEGKAHIGPDINSKFWQYEEISDGWVQLADFPIITDEGNSFNKPYYTFTTNDKIYYGNSLSGELWSYDILEDAWITEPSTIFKDNIGIRSFITNQGVFLGFGVKSLGNGGFRKVMNTWQYVPSN